jgi:hypothetical protein
MFATGGGPEEVAMHGGQIERRRRTETFSGKGLWAARSDFHSLAKIAPRLFAQLHAINLSIQYASQ